MVNANEALKDKRTRWFVVIVWETAHCSGRCVFYSQMIEGNIGFALYFDDRRGINDMFHVCNRCNRAESLFYAK